MNGKMRKIWLINKDYMLLLMYKISVRDKLWKQKNIYNKLQNNKLLKYKMLLLINVENKDKKLKNMYK